MNVSPSFYTTAIMLMLIHISIMAQKKSTYIRTDSTIKYGVPLKDNLSDVENSRYCHIVRGKNVVRHTPYDIKEYGFENGDVYLSKEIKLSVVPQRIFLQRLNQGKINLYYYQSKQEKIFFIEETPDSLVKIQRKNNDGLGYKKQLANFLKKYPNVQGAIKVVDYNKQSMQELFRRVNNNAPNKPFPHFTYGFSAGYKIIYLQPSVTTDFAELTYLNFDYEKSYVAGIWLEQPFIGNNFSFKMEALLSQYTISEYMATLNRDYEFLASFTALQIPLLLRYAMPLNIVRPYVCGGVVLSTNIKHNSTFHVTEVIGDNTFLRKIGEPEILDKNTVGLIFGAGIEYDITARNSVFIEFSVDKLFDMNLYKSLNYVETSITTGVKF